MKKISKKAWIILMIVLVVIVAFTATVFAVFSNRKKAYRLVKIYELNGTASVSRKDVGQMEAYPDMVLESGDTIVLSSGEMTLKLDDDKYVYVEPDTEFELVATGHSSNSKTTISLNHGAITNEIQNPLQDHSSYEVNTPNSNMAVRGTVYRVYTYYENNIRYTKVSVFDGKVSSRLRYSDGSLSKKTVMIEKGNEVLIYDDEENTDYVSKPGPIDYHDMPKSVLRLLEKIFGKLPEFESPKQEETKEPARETTTVPTTAPTTAPTGKPTTNPTDSPTRKPNNTATSQPTKKPVTAPSKSPTKTNGPEKEGPFTVTFMYQGQVFGTQTVKKGDTVNKPLLSPAQSGEWQFDFNKEITADITIEWR